MIDLRLRSQMTKLSVSTEDIFKHSCYISGHDSPSTSTKGEDVGHGWFGLKEYPPGFFRPETGFAGFLLLLSTTLTACLQPSGDRHCNVRAGGS